MTHHNPDDRLQKRLDALQDRLTSGEITPEDYDAIVARLTNTATPSESSANHTPPESHTHLGITGTGVGGVGPDLPELPSGIVLADRFRLDRELGRGGHAVVYLAEDELEGEHVALKVTFPHPGEAKTLRRDLANEIKSYRRIDSFKHIIRTYGVHAASHDGMDLILLSMEYAQGGNFADWLRKHRDDDEARLEKGLKLFAQACEGVKAIHDAKMVHLDLKPQNLLLCGDVKDPTVKVTDFGLTRQIGQRTLVTQASVAGGGGVGGTPYYMSPEQIRSARLKDLDHRADIYALGVILFELLDGDPPFDGSAEQVRQKHLEMTPPKLNGVDNDSLVQLVEQCLEKGPLLRPDTVRVIVDALEGKTTTKPKTKRSEGAKKKSTNKSVRNQQSKGKSTKSLRQPRDQSHFILPDLGEDIREAELVKWRVKRGDRVEKHQTLAEMETDKALVEVPSPWSGAIAELCAAEGDVVSVGSTLVRYTSRDDEDFEDSATVSPKPTMSLQDAALRGDLEQIRRNIAHGADVNAVEQMETACLESEVLKSIVDAHAYDVAVAGFKRGKAPRLLVARGLRQSPLHWAATMGHTSVISELVYANASPNAPNHLGWTPLHLAAWGGHVDTIEALAALGADVNAKDNHGQTPLHKAARNRHFDAIETLVTLWADVSAKDKDGKDPLHDASWQVHAAVAKAEIRRRATHAPEHRSNLRDNFEGKHDQ